MTQAEQLVATPEKGQGEAMDVETPSKSTMPGAVDALLPLNTEVAAALGLDDSVDPSTLDFEGIRQALAAFDGENEAEEEFRRSRDYGLPGGAVKTAAQRKLLDVRARLNCLGLAKGPGGEPLPCARPQSSKDTALDDTELTDP